MKTNITVPCCQQSSKIRSLSITTMRQLCSIVVCVVLFLSGCQSSTSATLPTTSTQSATTPITNAKDVSNTSIPTPTETSISTEILTDESADDVRDKLSINDTLTNDPLPTLTLVMVGDILLHTPVEQSALQDDGSYNFDALFAHTNDAILAADLALVNQEVIIGGETLGISGYPCFNAPFALCDSLKDAGFDVICHATNHALDKGKTGLLSCYQNWTEHYPELAILGIHDNAEAADELFLYTVNTNSSDPDFNSFTIAILNYTYGTNGIPLPKDMPYAVDLLDEKAVIADLQAAKDVADFIIVCPHWGTEYQTQPDAYQKKWAQIFLENGVDLVIGTHPHVIEPIEWMQDETTGHEMLIYYSLGNYVNWTSSSGKTIANRMVGGMATVTITLDEDGNTIISDYGIEALVCHLEAGTNGVTTYFLSDYTQELASQNVICSQDSNFSKEYCVDLCNDVWGSLWH